MKKKKKLPMEKKTKRRRRRRRRRRRKKTAYLNEEKNGLFFLNPSFSTRPTVVLKLSLGTKSKLSHSYSKRRSQRET
jgi:hypothetical protein